MSEAPSEADDHIQQQKGGGPPAEAATPQSECPAEGRHMNDGVKSLLTGSAPGAEGTQQQDSRNKAPQENAPADSSHGVDPDEEEETASEIRQQLAQAGWHGSRSDEGADLASEPASAARLAPSASWDAG